MSGGEQGYRRTGIHRISYADAAVDGLISGVIAGLLMAVALVFLGLFYRQSPAAVMSLIEDGGITALFMGNLVHLAVSSFYGLVFGSLIGFLHGRLPRFLPIWLLGVVYGLLIFILAEWIILPGIGSALLRLPAWSIGLAHVIYGFVLGLLLNRAFHKREDVF